MHVVQIWQETWEVLAPDGRDDLNDLDGVRDTPPEPGRRCGRLPIKPSRLPATAYLQRTPDMRRYALIEAANVADPLCRQQGSIIRDRREGPITLDRREGVTNLERTIPPRWPTLPSPT